MSTEIGSYARRSFIGMVRERRDGPLIAIIHEEVLRPCSPVKAATDAVLDVHRIGGGP